MSRWFDQKCSDLVTVKATDLKPGDVLNGLEVDCISQDLGMVVIQYKSGQCAFCHKQETFQVMRNKYAN